LFSDREILLLEAKACFVSFGVFGVRVEVLLSFISCLKSLFHAIQQQNYRTLKGFTIPRKGDSFVTGYLVKDIKTRIGYSLNCIGSDMVYLTGFPPFMAGTHSCRPSMTRRHSVSISSHKPCGTLRLLTVPLVRISH
jgi:hypothetical protein